VKLRFFLDGVYVHCRGAGIDERKVSSFPVLSHTTETFLAWSNNTHPETGFTSDLVVVQLLIEHHFP
jgi:hypothetical protein